MPMNDRRDLRHHLAGKQRHEHMMPRLRQVGGETVWVDGLIEDRLRDPVEQRDIAGFDVPDLEFHRPVPASALPAREGDVIIPSGVHVNGAAPAPYNH
jgi:hypothetical protein